MMRNRNPLSIVRARLCLFVLVLAVPLALQPERTENTTVSRPPPDRALDTPLPRLETRQDPHPLPFCRRLLVGDSRAAGAPGPIRSVALSPDGRLLAAGAGSTYRVWDLATAKILRTVTRSPNESEFAKVCFSQDGSTLVAGFSDGLIHVLAVSQNKLKSFQADLQFGLQSLRLSADSSQLLLVTAIECEVWDTRTQQRVTVCQVVLKPDEFLWEASFASDGQHVLGAGCNGATTYLYQWDVLTGKLTQGFPRLIPAHLPLAFLPGTERILLYSIEGVAVAVAPLCSCELLLSRQQDCSLPGNIFAWLSPDGRMAALADGVNEPGMVWVLEIASLRCLASLQTHPHSAVALCSPDLIFASARPDGTVGVLRIEPPAEPSRPQQPFTASDLFRALGDADPAQAFEAISRFRLTGETAIRSLRSHLETLIANKRASSASLIADLNHSRFTRRHAASAKLQQDLHLFEDELRESLQLTDSLEVRRRIELLLVNVEEPSVLSLGFLRTIMALELMDTDEARDCLAWMAANAPRRVSAEARSSLERLQLRSHRAE